MFSRIVPLAAMAIVVHVVATVAIVPNDAVGHQDEPYYIASTRTMLETRDLVLPRFEDADRIQKPILFYWLVLAPQGLTQPSLAAARVVSIVASAAVAFLAWTFSMSVFRATRHRLLLVWGLVAADIFLRYAHYAVPEMALTAFMSAAHIVFFDHVRRNDAKRPEGGRRLLFYGLMGGGFLIKGPVAIILPLLVAVAYLATRGAWRRIITLVHPPGIALMLLLICPWYLVLIARVGWDPFLDMMRRETVARVTVQNASLFYFLPICLAYFLPLTAFLVPAVLRPAAVARAATRWRPAQASYPMVWFLVYVAWYTLVVGEKHQWYALQWCIPWITILVGATRYRVVREGRVTVSGVLRSLCFIFAGVVAAAGWMLGPVLAPTAVIVLLCGVLLAGAAVLTLMRRWGGRFEHQFIVIALIAMALHHVVLQGIYPTTGLRPLPRFAEALRRTSASADLLICERYVRKKMGAFELPATLSVHYVPVPEDFRQQWGRQRPTFVVCREAQFEAIDPAVRNQYRVTGSGYLKKRAFPGGMVAAFQATWQTGDPLTLFDRVLLLQRGQKLTPPLGDDRREAVP